MHHATCLRPLALALLAVAGLGQPTLAAPVSASYQGIIQSDSGLGLLGQVLRVDFSYDASISGSPSGSATFYADFIESMTVRIGAHQWNWQPGGSASMFLNNDDVITFLIGTEDRIYLEAAGFSGPDIAPEPAGAESYRLSLFLSDNEPMFCPRRTG